MGHIDHGKSSLLDYIRKANVVAGEAGGITQHVAAYIATHNDRQITFLDTPGHEAFKSLRTRGAAAADIAILVVAADEGVKPQTLDALAAIKEARIPFIVAITKTDKPNADIERTKLSLAEHEIFIEGMGGDISYAVVSSKTGDGIPELLDLVLLAADLIELTADPDLSATGFVLETTQDPKRGASVTLIIKDGTLFKGTFVVAEDAFAPVRFIEDFRGERVETAGPSAPVRVSGFNKLPKAGCIFSIAESKKEAETLAAAQKKVAAVLDQKDDAESGVTVLPLVVKTDVAGSIDAISHELGKLAQEHVLIRIIASGVGAVTESDTKTASAAHAYIIAFNVSTDPIARDIALRDGVTILSFSIIYELAEKVQALLEEYVPKDAGEQELGRAKVLKIFSGGAKKCVIGARYISGALSLHDRVKIERGAEEIGRGKILNLQQSKIDANTIRTEGDFGIELETKAELTYGDEIVSFSEPSA
jgi:translation initiation factor IF-2